MFITSREQEHILSVLQKTKFMRKDQAVRLLSTGGFTRTAEYTMRCLEQLRHIRKIKWITADIFTLPIMYMEPVDDEMLLAIDVMLDLVGAGITALTAPPPPFKLCFFAGRDNNLGSYAVSIVRPGHEAEVTALLCGAEKLCHAVIFILSDLSQKDGIKTTLPHFFAVKDGGKYRYFRGVVDMQR